MQKIHVKGFGKNFPLKLKTTKRKIKIMVFFFTLYYANFLKKFSGATAFLLSLFFIRGGHS
jgi:hypothetical protein